MTRLLGFDVGSSYIKAALMDAGDGRLIATAASPEKEMPITAPEPGWAEQPPMLWWEHVLKAAAMLRVQVKEGLQGVEAVGISYQMHGLVLVGKDRAVLRPSILWCDSRSVEFGEEAARRIGHDVCLERLLNGPGNFTASKLKWVMENEPATYEKTFKAMLPGDYIAMRMTDEICTTPSGLSEAILWDFKEGGLAQFVLDHYGISAGKIPEVVPTFSVQGVLSGQAAEALGLEKGIEVAYRAGDQPNNALSLKVLHPGEVAATAGTSGVVYGVSNQAESDPRFRVNTFVHVNHTRETPRYGVLLCLNGTGILNAWVKNLLEGGDRGAISYESMNRLASDAPAGSKGLMIFPFGNGAERTLENRNPGASVLGLNFNIHHRAHVLRAVQEGIVFALNHGLGIMKESGIEVRKVRAGYGNMFLSPLFQEIFATVTGAEVELFSTDGAAGAARGAGLGAGIFSGPEEAFRGLEAMKVIEPNPLTTDAYREAFERWSEALHTLLGR